MTDQELDALITRPHPCNYTPDEWQKLLDYIGDTALPACIVDFYEHQPPVFIGSATYDPKTARWYSDTIDQNTLNLVQKNMENGNDYGYVNGYNPQTPQALQYCRRRRDQPEPENLQA